MRFPSHQCLHFPTGTNLMSPNSTAERSLYEISALQSTLAAHLDTQSAQVVQLVADSEATTENVGSGNKELKRAAERKSVARGVFWASCGLSLFLVGWDLLI